MSNDGLFPVVVETGLILGSVRIVGDLPEALTAEDADKLIHALRVVRDNSMHKMDVTLVMKLKGTRCRV